MSTAQMPNDAASIQSALTAPTSVMSPPASAYAKKPARRSVVLSRPVTRSSGTLAARAMSGMSVALAASPGPRSAPAIATNTNIVGKCSSPKVCSSGTMATTAVLPVSASTLMRRAPTRSISGPPMAFTSTNGAISAMATTPVFTGEPVVISTNHGMAIALTRVPQIDTTFATRNANNGARRRPSCTVCLMIPTPLRRFARERLDLNGHLLGTLRQRCGEVWRLVLVQYGHDLAHHRLELIGPEVEEVVRQQAGLLPVRRQRLHGIDEAEDVLGVGLSDPVQEAQRQLGLLVQQLGGVELGALVCRLPPPVAGVAAAVVLLHQSGLGQLPQVVAGGAGVHAEPSGQAGGGLWTVDPEKTQHPVPHRVCQRPDEMSIQPNCPGLFRALGLVRALVALVHDTEHRTAKTLCKEVLQIDCAIPLSTGCE